MSTKTRAAHGVVPSTVARRGSLIKRSSFDDNIADGAGDVKEQRRLSALEQDSG